MPCVRAVVARFPSFDSPGRVLTSRTTMRSDARDHEVHSGDSMRPNHGVREDWLPLHSAVRWLGSVDGHRFTRCAGSCFAT